jgi:hypothetical protein
MNVFLVYIIAIVVFAYTAQNAHAIIFLPALILVPIAKVIALVIAGASLPALGFGTLFSKLFGKSWKKTMLVMFIILFVAIALLAIYLKIQNPDRPFF